MPQDYIHYGSNRKSERKTPWLAILLLSVILLLLIAFFFWLFQKEKTPKPIEQKPKAAKAIVVEAKPIGNLDQLQKAAPKQKLQFDFYTILPKMKVELAGDTSSNTNDARYLLQIASTSDLKKANALKETLIKQGFDIHLSTIERDDLSWYRLQMGPFKDYQIAKTTQTALETKQIHAILLKINK